nr:hypothetical protein [Tanacetum cinerariifolium]
LAAHVTTLEKKFADFEQKSQTLANATQNLRSRVFTLKLWDMPHKINQTINEVSKEAIHIAFQVPLRDHFREQPEANMKESLHQRMFESVKDVPISDDVNISNSVDTNTVHLPKIKLRHDWLKPLSEEDRPKTPKLDWIIPLTDLPKAENKWVDALAKSYKDLEENKILSKTRDMGSFIKWLYKKDRKEKAKQI